MSKFNRFTLLFLLIFLYAPIFMLVIYSFNASRLVSVWTGFSLEWYAKLFTNKAMWEALWVSLQAAFFSATLATILGMMAAYGVVRHKYFKGKVLAIGLFSSPLVLPEILFGLALLLLFIALDLPRGLFTLILAHATFGSAFTFMALKARFEEFDFAQEEAALDLGATPLQAFFKVIFPQISAALISAWLLAFTLSLDDVVIASFVTGPGSTTLPMRIFSQARLGITPEINALSTLIILSVSLLLIFSLVIGRISPDKPHL